LNTLEQRANTAMDVTRLITQHSTRLRGALSLLLASAVALVVMAALGAGSAAAATKAAAKISAATCKANKAAGTINDVVGNEFGPGAGGIEDFVAESLGFFKTECLTVKLIATDVNAVELVSSGTAQIGGAGSAADFLESAANGANIEGIDTFGDQSPYTLLTTTNITNLTQLEGQNFGYHTQTPVILLEELKAAGVDLSKVNFVNDTSYNPLLLTQTNDFAAIQAYTDNEPLTLKAANQPFTEWDPSKFGVHGTYDPEYANRTFVRKHPTAIADFVRADIYALDYCYKHATQCINIEAKYAAAAGATYPIPHKLQQFQLAEQDAKDGQVKGLPFGAESYAEWTPEYNALLSLGVVSSLPPLSQVENVKIVQSLYKGSKLIWPGT
jgi:ABC-type nitrate/sulfonate/bicarbonate transport system substrate-binding protein